MSFFFFVSWFICLLSLDTVVETHSMLCNWVISSLTCTVYLWSCGWHTLTQQVFWKRGLKGEGEGWGCPHAGAAVKFCERQALYLLCRSHVHKDKFRARVRVKDIFTVWAGVTLLVTRTDHRDSGQDVSTLPPPSMWCVIVLSCAYDWGTGGVFLGFISKAWDHECQK